MTLMSNGKAQKIYKVALSREPSGAKEREGDHKVPEGEYLVDSKNPHSRFHFALHISYPNDADKERARKLGVNPGGLSKSTASTASMLGLAACNGNSTGRTGV